MSTIDYGKLALHKRSIIRLIGSQLPLPNAARPRFEVLPNGSHVVCEQKKSLFSLTDIAQILDIPEIIGTLPVRHSVSSPDLTLHETVQAAAGMKTNDSTLAPADNGVNNKITALEDELAQLRMQIAMLVSNQQNQGNTSLNDSNVSTVVPQITSTPIKSQSVAPPPPPPPMGVPPPPPPPPPCGLIMNATSKMSVTDIIKQRKLSKSQSCLDMTTITKKNTSLPAMADILKDMHKVKLRSVTRSPNGTPINEKKKETIGTDPASMIAAALKKKFAHRQNFADSPDKNDSGDAFSLRSTTPNKNFDEESPEIPKFGQHLLRKRGSRKTTSSSLFKTERKTPTPPPPQCVS